MSDCTCGIRGKIEKRIAYLKDCMEWTTINDTKPVYTVIEELKKLLPKK